MPELTCGNTGTGPEAAAWVFTLRNRALEPEREREPELAVGEGWAPFVEGIVRRL